VNNPLLCIVGLGYVGLPLAHAFAKEGYAIAGYDVSEERVKELKNGHDRTNELTENTLKSVAIDFSTDPSIISKADVVILAIPTPVDAKNRPDLTLLKGATKTVGKYFKDGAIIVYESTVYPGVTEEICGPILAKESKGKNFSLGYSPERVNPGDKEHTIENIIKIVAGQDTKTLDSLAELYGSIIKAGIHRAPSIKVAEMAKAIENAQRDLNIAYMNEIAKFCNRMGISTKDVLDAAKTKWNFLHFSPGLVGGHCIGVDPYYLLEKAEALGGKMPIVSAARKTNDKMPIFVWEQIIAALGKPKGKQVLVLGLTFKENVPDARNSKSIQVINLLRRSGCIVTTHDPYHQNHALEGHFDAIILLVPHREYCTLSPSDFRNIAKETCLFYDLKSAFGKESLETAGFRYLSL